MHWRTHKALVQGSGGLAYDGPFDLAQRLEMTNRALADLGLLCENRGDN